MLDFVLQGEQGIAFAFYLSQSVQYVITHSFLAFTMVALFASYQQVGLSEQAAFRLGVYVVDI
jgi:hypothetical protein